MASGGAIFGILGALAAFPRRLAAREVARRHGVLRRGITRRTSHVVFGRKLLHRLDEAAIEKRFAELSEAGTVMLSENGFRRHLGLLKRPEGAQLSRRSLLEQSRLPTPAFDLLSLFDAFEHDAEPYSFRDVILARQYAGLLATGAGWAAIARSVRRAGEVASLTAMALRTGDDDEIYVRDGETLREIDGQRLLDFGADADRDADMLFEEAEEAEEGGEFARAAALYGKSLSLDPDDSVAAFNRANCLRAAGDPEGAAHAYALALKRDPGFVEAWFNFGSLLAETKKTDAARTHLRRALEIDPLYPDPVYNLAALEFEAERLDEARLWWSRYLELDPGSEWGRRAARGIQYVDLAAQMARTGQGKSA